ncbi:MAG TPA: aldehyde dehydrogenase family protein [Acidimicrobiales bacterium]|nr:aldehyde dehydrogenase family protein [Acidimicrobiales bacterium]
MTSEATIASASGVRFASINPADPRDVVGSFATATAADVTTAIGEAEAAHAEWSQTPPSRRAPLVAAVAHAIARETAELVELITREEGKTLAESRVEVQKSVEQFNFASQLAYQLEGTTFPDEEASTFTYTVRVPLGVVVAITPWNFPLSLPARKIAPAIAAGNAVVFKPSPATAGVGAALVRICEEAGLPRGLVRLVQGDDPDAMSALVSDSRVRAVTFTGSDRVGELLHRTVRAGTRLQFELGGHNIVVVCADADLDSAADLVVRGATGLAGQACTATDRVLVERPVYGAFRDLVAAAMTTIRVGPGAVAGVSCGPVATAAQHERLERLRASALGAGAEIVGEALLSDGLERSSGYFVTPTAFAAVDEQHPLAAGEVFGPYFSIAPIGGVDEGLAAVNDDEHGLVTAIHTSSLATAGRFSRDARCGIVKVNRRTTGNGVAPPFGGWKRSSSGAFPEGGRQALDFFTDTKTVYTGL